MLFRRQCVASIYSRSASSSSLFARPACYTRSSRNQQAPFLREKHDDGSPSSIVFTAPDLGSGWRRWGKDDGVNTFRDVQAGRAGPSPRQNLSWIQRSKQLVGAHRTQETEVFDVAGRVTAIRRSGKNLVFLDISVDNAEQMHSRLQVQFNRSKLGNDVTEDQFGEIFQRIRRGDHISARGTSEAMPRQDLLSRQILAHALPRIESPCLHALPVERKLNDRDTAMEATAGRHVEMLTHPELLEILHVRQQFIRSIRKILEEDFFLEVQTPIISASTGGAIARPFQTSAGEFPDRKLALRIAPELWLKRLIIGGANRVFEIGQCFRNEGLDRTHNPEFTTCEFYTTYIDIHRLMVYTEVLLNKVLHTLGSLAKSYPCIDREFLRKWETSQAYRTRTLSFKTLDFIPSINECIGRPLPYLASPTAREEILEICRQHSVPIPQPATLPRLLDKLSSHFLEPQCEEPTWITNIPECLSPLSKSFTHPSAPNEQPVAARAELYMKCKEVVNCYEEENSPDEQRRKFMDQQLYARDPDDDSKVDEEAMKIDEDYIEALQWGLPPTGGWGCGIDRLVMLITGQERITDVLAFGNLRAVTRHAEKWEETDEPTDRASAAATPSPQDESTKQA